MYAFGASFQDSVTTISKISDEPEALTFFEPRMGLFDKAQRQFRFFLVGKTMRFDLGFRWPPESSGVWQTKHPVAYSGKTNRQADDDETNPISRLFRPFRGRAIMLPTSPTDRLATVLIQCVVNDNQDLAPFCAQCLNQNPEKAIGYKVNAPSTFSQKSVNGGKVPGIMKSHCKNYLTHCVLSYGQRPADQQSNKDAVTRGAEASHKSDLVNPQWIWYLFVQSGVPPSHVFVSKKWVRAERLLFQPFSL